ncbi:DUF45 domain-containing protein [Natronococcus sp. A-GB1]|uniref:YgjP-like metallopeptidase domain-containing protein n=1 Tax=Natronococcus sp. A-GB1 TaxID=3037648 RepID=UPI00241CD12F|nr:YgjP-like metallopeptidase domain-containing protein [Natronococcus sp. A-GB1]MDG5760657.1 DUF45 domain-containing protein [Natronococcus sp. A-GB1]
MGLQIYNAKCGPRPAGRIYYRVNASEWKQWEWPERVRLVIHEMAHTQHVNHSPEFWEEVADSYLRFEERWEEVEDIVGEPVSRKAGREEVVKNPITSMVDNRIETAYERRLKLAEKLGHPTEDIDPISGMEIRSGHQPNGNEEIAVPMADVEYEEYDPVELAAHFRSRPRPGIWKDKNVYHVTPPKAVKTSDGGYRVVEGEKRAGIRRYGLGKCSEDLMTVEVVDSDEDVGGDAAVADD